MIGKDNDAGIVADNGENFALYFQDFVKTRKVREGGDILAKVIAINENYVFLNAGLKSESRVAVEEFLSDDGTMDINVGDTVEVEVEMLENGLGEAVLSRRNARRKKAWEKMKAAMESDGSIEGVIQSRVKGGFSVLCDGVRAFLPGSLVDVFPIADQNALVGQRMEFKPIKINNAKNSVVLSRRAIIERNMTNRDGGEATPFNEGDRISGTVRSITDYGAFVEIGNGVFGLLHITDISWKHVVAVTDVLSVGDTVDVVIVCVIPEKGRISLSMKRLQPDPWEFFDRTHPVGSRIFGKIVRLEDYGAFVEVAEGVQGLVHSSEISWKRKSFSSSKVWQIGEEVEVMVLEIDKARHRISLGSKQCQPNPWQEFSAAYRKGDTIKGVVSSINEHGMFVELPGEIDGLVRLSDLSYEEDGAQAILAYKKDQGIEAAVLSIDVERERIGLGIKQLSDGEFEAFASKHLKGTKVMGLVSGYAPKGAHVKLAENVRAYLPINEISESRVEKVEDHVKENEEMEFILIDIDRKNHRAIVSLKEKYRSLREKSLRDNNAKPSPKLGDLLQAKLEESKADNEAKAKNSD